MGLLVTRRLVKDLMIRITCGGVRSTACRRPHRPQARDQYWYRFVFPAAVAKLAAVPLTCTWGRVQKDNRLLN